MNKRNLFVAAGILSVLAAFLVYGFFFKRPNIVKPKVGPIVEAIYALGTVKSDDIYILKMGITSGLTKLYVT
ncbi:MAG: secretion protein HlyD, partial [Leptospiraceae bacterium]|nr:secretion protein HlyD [Leptospiraceae bacterium]